MIASTAGSRIPTASCAAVFAEAVDGEAAEGTALEADVGAAALGCPSGRSPDPACTQTLSAGTARTAQNSGTRTATNPRPCPDARLFRVVGEGAQHSRTCDFE